MQEYTHSNKTKTKKRKSQMPILSIIIFDILIVGISLMVFALFHHIIPTSDGLDLSKINDGTATPRKSINTNNINTDGSNENTDENSAGTEDIGWGGKFPDMFTSGEIIKEENSYKSKDVNITLTKVQENGITYYIQDIYIRYIENLRTAFADDKYGKGHTKTVSEMAENNDAIGAINGDYYSTNLNSSVVIRNGFEYRGENPFGDVCVVFYNGEMKTYSKNEFKYNEIANEGDAYQAWCFGPSLLENGKSKTEFDSSVQKANPRTAIGYYEPGHYCFVLVDGRQDNYSKGMTMKELSNLFESLGCKEAYNLDGGQSSVMTFNGSVANKPYDGGRTSSDIVLVRELKEGDR